MNNNIKESYCSFEVSKLLKENGFDVPCTDCYNERGMLYSAGWCESVDDKGIESPFSYTDLSKYKLNYILTPTHALAIEWIRLNFGICIQSPFPKNDKTWEWVIFLLNNPLEGTDGYKNVMSLHQEKSYFKTPQEATEAALLYVLQNLTQ